MQADGLQQSISGIKAIGGLGGGVVVLWVVYEIADLMLVQAGQNAPGGFGGAVANDWLGTGLDVVLPLTFLGLVFFGLIMDAVTSRRYL